MKCPKCESYRSYQLKEELPELIQPAEEGCTIETGRIITYIITRCADCNAIIKVEPQN